MSQYASTVVIQVSNSRLWETLGNISLKGFNLAKLEKVGERCYRNRKDMSYTEEDLTDIVQELAGYLGDDGIVVASTTNINIDPIYYFAFYLGERVRIDADEREENFIGRISEWLNTFKIVTSEQENKTLLKCGIAAVDNRFESFPSTFTLPDRVYIRETSFEGRSDAIEKCSLDEDVYLISSKADYDSMRLEVLSEHGSLGFLPSDVSDEIAPAFLSGHLEYSAKITELVPLSQRNKYAKSSIVGITLEAIFTENIVAKKLPSTLRQNETIVLEENK